MDTIETCRRHVTSILSAARRRDSEAAHRISCELRKSSPDVAYASVVAALRATAPGQDFQAYGGSADSKWIQRHFIINVEEALRDRAFGCR